MLVEGDTANFATLGGVPLSVKLSFYLGAAVFLGTVIWTVVTTPEATEVEPLPVGEDGMVKQIWDAVRTMPPMMRRLMKCSHGHMDNSSMENNDPKLMGMGCNVHQLQEPRPCMP